MNNDRDAKLKALRERIIAGKWTLLCDVVVDLIDVLLDAERERGEEKSTITPQRSANDWAKLRQIAMDRMDFISANREELIAAWIAKTGVSPEDAVLHEQRLGNGDVKVWVERKPALDTPPPDATESDEELISALIRISNYLRIHQMWVSEGQVNEAIAMLRARSTECRELKAEVEIWKDQIKFDTLLLKAGEAQTEELRAENEKLKFQLEGYIQQNAQLAQPLMSQPASVFHSYIGPAVKEAGE